MKYWQFMDYCNENGQSLIMQWYAQQDPAVQANFDVVLNTLAGSDDWSDLEEFRVLTGRHVGLGELRFKVGKRRFRPVGFWGYAPREFVLILGCEKSGRIYMPNNAFDLALDLQLAFFWEGKGTIREHS